MQKSSAGLNVVRVFKMVYMDNSATTKVDESVVFRITEFISKFGNASSQHTLGREVREEVEASRKKLADFIGADPEEIIFTSGGTESDNFALKGLAKANPEKKHIITSIIEHPAIGETCEALKREGYKIDIVGVDKEGIVDVAEIEKKITKDTLVVSIMHVNNEIGTIQPIAEIGALCKKKNVYFHTDAVQSFKKIKINVKEMNIDLLSVSGHKINAPKGIGFIYIKLGTRIKPLIDGGGQEFRLRGGTENSLGIIALAAALDVDNAEERVKGIRDYMMNELEKVEGTLINGSKKDRIYNNLSVSFFGIEGEGLMLLLEGDEIYVSTGSACASHKLEESYVLNAIGVPDLYVHGSIRISLGQENTMDEAKIVVEKIKEHVQKLRAMSPFKLEDANSEEAHRVSFEKDNHH